MVTDQHKADQQLIKIESTHVLRGLAVFDSVLLIYIVIHFGWATFTVPNLNTQAAPIIYIVLLIPHLCELALVAGLTIYVSLGIICTLRRTPLARRRERIIGTINFLMTLTLTGLLWLFEIFHIIYSFRGYWLDRLLLVEHFASVSWGDLRGLLPGFNQYRLNSNGMFLFSLLTFLYLSEKYMFELWGRRRSVTLLPILAISTLIIIGIVGEIKQGSYVNRQEWHVMNSEKSWPDAVAACQKLGEGWRLPRRTELALFLAKRKPPTLSSNLAWTSTLVNDGASAIAVQTSPERSGIKRERDVVYDHNPCVTGGSIRLTKRVSSWSIFTEILSYACLNEITPSLFPSKLLFIAAPTGIVKMFKGDKEVAVHAPYAETICIKPESSSFIPPVLGNKYANEINFESQAALETFLHDQCQSGKLTSNPATCLP